MLEVLYQGLNLILKIPDIDSRSVYTFMPCVGGLEIQKTVNRSPTSESSLIQATHPQLTLSDKMAVHFNSDWPCLESLLYHLFPKCPPGKSLNTLSSSSFSSPT